MHRRVSEVKTCTNCTYRILRVDSGSKIKILVFGAQTTSSRGPGGVEKY
jgi:hypothetical protein